MTGRRPSLMFLFPNELSCLGPPGINWFPSDTVCLPGFQDSSQQPRTWNSCGTFTKHSSQNQLAFFFVLVRLYILVSHHSTHTAWILAQLMPSYYLQLIFCSKWISTRYCSLQKIANASPYSVTSRSPCPQLSHFSGLYNVWYSLCSNT